MMPWMAEMFDGLMLHLALTHDHNALHEYHTPLPLVNQQADILKPA